MKTFLQKWGLLLLTVLTFFFLLGNRALNEPDEGRYSEIGREMAETGDWLVPHLWYLPHLDKPPMTYWLEGASIKLFGQNEWAVRLPLALAAISGVWATFLLGCAMGGRRLGFWSAIVLQSSLLYFVMARQLTTDMYLTQFVAWAMYFFWRGRANAERGTRSAENLIWSCAGWLMLALAFLTKGPIALAIPAAAFGALLIYRRNEIRSMRGAIGRLVVGLVIFLAIAAPWFIAVFRTVPDSAHFMVFGQAAGHFLGTTIKNRAGSPFYFFAILFVGLMPWTVLLGWLWRRAHWRSLEPRAKEAWLLLSVWVIFTFVLFSFSHAKLPAYILPIFPPLAILLAWRFGDPADLAFTRQYRICAVCALLLPLLLPLALRLAFSVPLSPWLLVQTALVVLVAGIVIGRSGNWAPARVMAMAAGLALVGYFLTVSELPQFENSFRGNQTMKPLGEALRANYQPGDAIVCWNRLPQGLPFYSGGVISATNRPYFGGMDLTQMPFRFPGNAERLGDRLLADDDAMERLLQGERRVWIVAPQFMVEHFAERYHLTVRRVMQAGQWELFSNR